MTTEELNKAFAEQAALLKELREHNDKLVKGQSDRAEAMEKMQARLNELEDKLNRPPAASKGSDKEEGSKKREAFTSFMRKGRDDMRVEEKALVTYDDTLGGYLAPAEYVAEIIKDEQEYTPLEQYMTVRPTSSGQVNAPKRTGVFTATKVSEGATRTERTGLTYGLEQIRVFSFYALSLASIEDLQDSAFDVEAIVREESAEQLGVAKSTTFITGDGITEAEGVLTNASVSYTAGGHASLLNDADKIIDLTHAVKATYARNGRFLLNRTTLGKVRLLKDGTGNYLLQQGLASGLPATIYGYPYTEAVEMPDIAANAYPIVFGDFKRAYWVVNRIGMTVQRLVERYDGMVGFHVYQRWGGRVVNPAAIRKLKIATS